MSGSEELEAPAKGVKKYSKEEANDIVASLGFEKLEGILPAIAVD